MTVTASSATHRFRRGTREVVSVPSPASTAIMPGDLIWLNSGVASIASLFSWDTNLATTQPEFRVKFLGVAADMKLASDASTRDILVEIEGVYSYDCAALGSAYHVGQPFGPAKDTGNNLRDQLVAPVATYNLGIGLLAKEAAQGDTSVLLRIQSFLLCTQFATSS